MSRRRPRPNLPRAAASPAPVCLRKRRRGIAPAAIGLVVAASWAAYVLAPESPTRLRARAEAAERAEDWPEALAAWGTLNRTPRADARSLLAEARAALALGRAARADRALVGAMAEAPADPEPALLRLELLRMEDRAVEAARVGWATFEAVAPDSRREVLRALTLALLDDAPDDLARATLQRWIAADPADADALVALYRRIAPMPRLGDPDVSARIAALQTILDRDPSHVDAREVLIQTLADAGDPARGRLLLDAWPGDARDARYQRLAGRWALDYERKPALAVASLRHALTELPHDWRTRYRLARALRADGRAAEARRAAETVALLREALDPVPLGRRLTADLGRLDDIQSRLDLADLCARVGLTRLADAWRLDAQTPRPRNVPGGP